MLINQHLCGEFQGCRERKRDLRNYDPKALMKVGLGSERVETFFM